MIYFYDKENGQIINAGRLLHLERIKTYYNGAQRWVYILKTGQKTSPITKYYPCSQYDLYMITQI